MFLNESETAPLIEEKTNIEQCSPTISLQLLYTPIIETNIQYENAKEFVFSNEYKQAQISLNFCFPIEICIKNTYYIVPIDLYGYEKISKLKRHVAEKFHLKTEDMVYLNTLSSEKFMDENIHGTYKEFNSVVYSQQIVYECAEMKEFGYKAFQAQIKYEDNLNVLRVSNENEYELVEPIDESNSKKEYVKQLYLTEQLIQGKKLISFNMKAKC